MNSTTEYNILFLLIVSLRWLWL